VLQLLNTGCNGDKPFKQAIPQHCVAVVAEIFYNLLYMYIYILFNTIYLSSCNGLYKKVQQLQQSANNPLIMRVHGVAKCVAECCTY
jgi:hypothetical protein